MATIRTRPMYLEQKHRASRLHYDFRLEIGGVLKSWAIPKGPSLDPAMKRLAVQVEDHDLSYANFEGIKGPTSAAEMLHAGALEFRLHGERLKGLFALVEMKGKSGQWLLIKRRDAAARPGSEVTRESQDSVLSGRTIEDLADAAAAGLLGTYRCGTCVCVAERGA